MYAFDLIYLCDFLIFTRREFLNKNEPASQENPATP